MQAIPKEIEERMKKVKQEWEATVQSMKQQIKKEDDEAKLRDERIEKDVAARLVALTGKMTTIQAELAKAEAIQKSMATADDLQKSVAKTETLQKSMAKADDLKAVLQKLIALEQRFATLEARVAKLEAK